MAGARERVRGVVERGKAAVGSGDPPLATNVGGRVEAVREALRAFGSGDIDRFLSAFDDEAEWISPQGENFPGAGTHRGREAIKNEFVDAIRLTYSSFGFDPAQYLDAEDEQAVVVRGAFSGEPADGTRLETPGVQVWEFDKSRVVRVQVYADSYAFPRPLNESEHKKHQEEQEAKARESEGSSEESEDSRDREGTGEPQAGSEGEGERGEGRDSESEAEARAEESTERGQQPSGHEEEGTAA